MKAGDIFNRLTFLREAHGRYGVFECSCGSVKEILKYHVKSGATQSCGCFHKEVVSKHGQHSSREYAAWQNMLARVKRHGNPSHRAYGVRKLGIAKEWESSFENFHRDMGEMPDSRRWTLERVDNDVGYYPSNCKWALWSEQAKNRGMTSLNTSGHTGIDIRLEEDKYLTVRARVTHDKTVYSKRFPVSRYGSLDAAITEAVSWRNSQKDLLGGFSEKHGLPITQEK